MIVYRRIARIKLGKRRFFKENVKVFMNEGKVSQKHYKEPDEKDRQL